MLSNASKLRHLAANAGRASSVNSNYFSAFSASSSSGLTSSITSPPPSTSSYSVRTLSQSAVLRKTFEPDYLDSSVPEIPAYPPINIQLKGYNFDVLESFQSFVHRTAENMGVDVQEAWPTPAKSYKIATYIDGSTRIKSEVKLNMYERNVQLVNLRSVDALILFDTIRAALPQGVNLTAHEHKVEYSEERWIPDPFINSLRDELSEGQEKLAAEKEKRQEATAAKAARKQAALLKSLQGEDDD